MRATKRCYGRAKHISRLRVAHRSCKKCYHCVVRFRLSEDVMFSTRLFVSSLILGLCPTACTHTHTQTDIYTHNIFPSTQQYDICIYFSITYIVILATCFDSYESSSGINIQELLVHIVLQFFMS